MAPALVKEPRLKVTKPATFVLIVPWEAEVGHGDLAGEVIAGIDRVRQMGHAQCECAGRIDWVDHRQPQSPAIGDAAVVARRVVIHVKRPEAVGIAAVEHAEIGVGGLAGNAGEEIQRRNLAGMVKARNQGGF